MLASDFDYSLPADLIAQRPAQERDESRLLVLRRGDGTVTHHGFKELPQFLRVTVGLDAENTRFLAALKEVLAGAPSGATGRG